MALLCSLDIGDVSGMFGFRDAYFAANNDYNLKIPTFVLTRQWSQFENIFLFHEFVRLFEILVVRPLDFQGREIMLR